MGQLDRDGVENHIMQMAEQLWLAEDCPDGQTEHYRRRAEQILGLQSHRSPELPVEAERGDEDDLLSIHAAVRMFSKSLRGDSSGDGKASLPIA